MKKNHLLLLLCVAFVVGLASIYFRISQSAGWSDSKTDRTIFPDLTVNDITKAQIRSAPTSVTLEKKDDKWRVAERDDYPADFTKIRDLIKLLWALKSGQETQVGPSQLGRLKLLAPGQNADSGIEIDLQGNKGKPLASLIIGKTVDRSTAATGSAAGGRFVYNPAIKDRVYLVSESFFSVDPVNVGSWLDKTFIAPGELVEIDQTAWSNNPGWKVTRKDSKTDWQMEDLKPGESLDKSFAQSLSTFAPTFVDVRPSSASSEETGLKEAFKIRVKTLDGFTYDFLIGREGPDKTHYLQLSVSADLPSARTSEPNESADDKKKKDEEFDKKNASFKERLEQEKQFEKWVFLVPDYNLEQILKRRDEIISKPSPSPSPAGAAAPEPATPSPAPVSLLPSTPSPAPAAASSPAPVSAASPTPIPESSPTVSPQ
jgi:hypothetical protein